MPFELVDHRIEEHELMARLAAENAAANTCPLDLTGHPALTLPIATAGPDDLPVGLQIIGPRYHEEQMYRVAFALERQFMA
jgi:amidase